MQVNSGHMKVKSNEKIIEKNLKDRMSRLRYKKTQKIIMISNSYLF
jgi:hypothetical protein